MKEAPRVTTPSARQAIVEQIIAQREAIERPLATAEDWQLVIEDHARRLMQGDRPAIDYRNKMIHIASIALAAVEAHDQGRY